MEKLVEAIKSIIKQTIDTNKFSDVIFGEVIAVDPLKIKINNIITLEEENLYLTTNVIDHEIDVTVKWWTEFEKVNKIDKHTHPNTAISPDIDSNHRHKILNKKKMIVHNKLLVGEKVFMVKAFGGQRYLVIDRITKFKPKGEWI